MIHYRSVLLGVLVAASFAVADDPDPIPSQRIPWRNDRLVGSPEPPLPYTVERDFTGIDWKSPMYVAPVPNTDQLWVVLQGGDKDQPSRIVRCRDDSAATEVETMLRIARRLIYGLTFHPDFATNGHVFIFSNGPWGEPGRANRVSRFTISRQPTRHIDPGSELTILEWNSEGHDGGDLAFGLDGMLYITAGDGTSDSDLWNSGQDMNNLLATLIRIDVDHPAEGQPYSVPTDNPFVNLPGARPEIWAYGFRNPWRMCVDSRTGDIWVGNNGQDLWETAQLVNAGDNYGWSVYEGRHPFYLHRQRGPTPIVPPTIEHPHSEFRSLTGGVVYYGRRFPELNGTYVYGDYETGRVWGARQQDGKLVWNGELADTSLQIAAFRVDQRGELLIVDHGGGIYRLKTNEPVGNRQPFPDQLSATGLFASLLELEPAPGVVPYSVNASAWSDGATAQRLLAIPDDLRIDHQRSSGWDCPDGSVLAQTLTVPTDHGDSSSRRRIETRLLVRHQNEWAGYSYRWNDEQTDATLVPKQGDSIEIEFHDPLLDSGVRRQTWRFPSRTECLVCHSRAANHVLGLSDPQMNRQVERAGTTENQLRMLERLGYFKEPLPKPPEELSRLVDPSSSTEPIDARARSYLHVNCSICHVEAGGGNSKMELDFSTTQEKMNLIEARPQHDSFGIPNAMLVAPGQPDQSVLPHRLSRRGPGQMPPLVTTVVDEQAVSLFHDWIRQLKSRQAFVRAWQMADLLSSLSQVHQGRSFENGKKAFQITGCVQCHRFSGEGGTVGPDLSGIHRRLNPHDLLESIIEPSKVIAEQYAGVSLQTEDGRIVSGRIESEDADAIVVAVNPLTRESVRLSKTTITYRSLSKMSNMPAGTVNSLDKIQILDLLAYLTSDGKPDHANFNAAAALEPKAYPH